MSGVIDASNGLIVSDPEYDIIENFGPVKAGASKSICPANSYMGGIENKDETMGVYLYVVHFPQVTRHLICRYSTFFDL